MKPTDIKVEHLVETVTLDQKRNTVEEFFKLYKDTLAYRDSIHGDNREFSLRAKRLDTLASKFAGYNMMKGILRA
jgi:hypothetical protein